MRNQKKLAKAKNLAVKNLTYLYLKANLDAIEKEMSENEPVQLENNKGIISKVISTIATEVANGIRRKNTLELSNEKVEIIESLSTFEKANSEKDLELAKDINKLKAYINKKIFKKDKNNLLRKQFALSFALNMAGKHSRWEDGLEQVSSILFDDEGYIKELYNKFQNNFYSIQKKVIDGNIGYNLAVGLTVFSLGAWSILPLAVGSVAALANYVAHKKELKQAFDNLSKEELHSFLALKLTLIEDGRDTMSSEDWSNLIDSTLKYLSNLRSDAEYEWLIEKIDGETNKAKIELCNLAIDRIAKIVGI